MPHRINGRGSYVIERQFRGVGRIRRASGTKNKKTFQAIDSMLTVLSDGGRYDTLALLRDGKMHPLDAYNLFRRGELQRLPSVEHVLPAEPHMLAWVDQYDCSESHRTSLQNVLRGFLRRCPGLPVAGLPGELLAYRKVLEDRPRQFNKTRAAVQAYLRDTLGRQSSLWQDVSNVRSLKEARKPAKALSAKQLVAALRNLPLPMQQSAWTCAVTGMGPKEYYGQWELKKDRVVIHGTKREGRERIVPRIGTPVYPTLGVDRWRRLLKELAGITPYQLRRTYAHLLEAAGIPFTRRDLYMGHVAKTHQARYPLTEVAAFLKEDRGKLSPYLSPYKLDRLPSERG